ncbi:ATP-binding protein [Quadrisphaera sp. INWT6]|uniref:ATP-binding protein n=1 Tax=Quadrisphaera sp. INWT6 TaxID=2596917 RepID=UPI001891FE57|nr:ATP-binding protein [Quadrisphaera sp. INWT6]
MEDWGAPTGSLPVVRELLGLQSFPPTTVSVRAARRFVQECLTGTSMEPLADDAGLLVCELAANAVLHARTDFDVAVSELHGGSGARVTVRDDAVALPTVTAPSATAMSGRGLALVQTLASRWGAGPSSSARKGVWFELDLATGHSGPGEGRSAADGGAELGVEELLAAWSDSGPTPAVVAPAVPFADSGAERRAVAPEPARRGAGDVLEVVLPALDAAGLLAAKEGMDDVLRELQLVLLDPRHRAASSLVADGPADDLDLARRLDTAARAFDAVRRQVRQQVALAVASGETAVELRLVLPAGTQAAAIEYMAAVEAAEELAEQGTLLSAGARDLLRHRSVRRAYLGEVIAAAGT